MDTLILPLEHYGMPPMEDLLLSAPRIDVQISLVIFHIIIWFILVNYIFIPIASRLIRCLNCKEQFIRCHLDAYKKMGLEVGDNEDEEIEFIAWWEGTILQHGIGGALCAPSALGMGYLFPTGIATAMACHGSLSELGCELEGMLLAIYEVTFGGEKGRKKNPMTLWIALIIHHTCSICLVVPLNIYYRNNVYYHEMYMWLQYATFLAFAIQQYGYTLDITAWHSLTQMKIFVSINHRH